MATTGLTRPVIYAAEQAAKTWARENGHTVNDRGRISAEIQAAYDKAHA